MMERVMNLTSFSHEKVSTDEAMELTQNILQLFSFVMFTDFLRWRIL